MKTVDLSRHPELFRGCAAPGRRMSDSLVELFNIGEKYLWRALCQSGVRLDFVTDSCKLEYSLGFGKPVRQIFTSDIFIDGEKITVDGTGPHRFSMAPGEKHIIIHLPHLVIIEKIELKIADDAKITAAEVPEKCILFCGDSITQGMVTATPSAAPAPLTAAALGMEFINTSVGGARMNMKHIELTMEIPGDILILALGVNDARYKMPYDDFRSKCEETIAKMIEFTGSKVVILPIPNIAGSTPDLAVYREIIRFTAAQYPQMKILDGYEFFPAKPELYCDKTHPNDEGSKIYASALANVLKTL